MTNLESPVRHGLGRPLHMLAFDHRGSFRRDLLGLSGTVSRQDAERIRTLKQTIFEGFELATADGIAPEVAGLLVDEEYGAQVARSAKAGGFTLAMPVERSGQPEFDFEFGSSFAEHVEAFDPDFSKVLVRYNVDGDRELNRRQSARLARLSGWLAEQQRGFLFELLVPAEPGQLAQVGGDGDRYDLELRPALVVRAVEELQQAGAEPDIWKIEGLERREHYERVVAQARSGHRDQVTCVVLGRGGDLSRVIRWLNTAAGVPGYVGFAVGRTLWLDPLAEYVAGRLTHRAAADRIAENYRRVSAAWTAAAARESTGSPPRGEGGGRA